MEKEIQYLNKTTKNLVDINDCDYTLFLIFFTSKFYNKNKYNLINFFSNLKFLIN